MNIIAQNKDETLWNFLSSSFIMEDQANGYEISAQYLLHDSIWQHIGPDSNDIISMAFGDDDAEIIYAASRDSGVFKTTDSGLNWFQSNNGITGNYIRSIDSHPNDGNIVLAGTFYDGLFRTTDGGITWSKVSTITAPTILNIVFDVQHGDTVYVGTFSSGLFRSTDAGVSWHTLSTGPPLALKILIDPLKKNIIYCISPGNPDVYKSENFGSTWNHFFECEQDIISMAINPLNNNIIYLGTNPEDSLYKTTDGGTTWCKYSIAGTEQIITDIIIDSNDTSNVFLSTPLAGVFRSTDSGVTWSELNEGLTVLQVLQLKFHPLTTSTMYAATNFGAIFKIDYLVTNLNETPNQYPDKILLYQNFPNPFNPITTIKFNLPKSSEVTLKIFNILGEEVATLVFDRLSAGSYSYEWSRTGGIASGVYLYRLQAGNYVKTRKMVLMR